MSSDPTLSNVLAVVLLVAVVVTLWTPGVVGADQQRTLVQDDRRSPTNFTVTWRTDANGNPQAPGAENVTVWAFARGFPVNLTPIGNLTIVAPGGQGSTCDLRFARSFGIDRGDNGGKSDSEPSVIQEDVTLYDGIHRSHNWTRPDQKSVTRLEFLFEGECEGCFGDASKNLYREDEIVVAQDECTTHPSRVGWYRWYGYLNGSNDGNPEDKDGDDWNTEVWFGDDLDEPAAAYSHWYYICECENRTEAERELGVPPQYHPNRTASVRAPNYESGLNLTLYHPGSRTRPLPTETPTLTATTTPTSTPSATPTATPPPASTPTDTSGRSPGFGVLSAVLALGAAALTLGARRRRGS